MEENRAEVLGRAVQEARAARNLTQADLAEKADLTRATVQKIEYGGTVRPATLAKVEPVLGWNPGTASAILAGDDAPLAGTEYRGRFYGPITEDDIRRAVTGAMVAATDVGAAEIRQVNRLVLDDLRANRLLPPEEEAHEEI